MLTKYTIFPLNYLVNTKHMISFVPMKTKNTTRKKKYSLSNEEIAKMFDYASVDSFNNSTAKERILKGIEQIIEHIEHQIAESIIQ